MKNKSLYQSFYCKYLEPNDVVINSFVAGTAQSVIGHPFDTIKTNLQFSSGYESSSHKWSVIRRFVSPSNVLKVYRGLLLHLSEVVLKLIHI